MMLNKLTSLVACAALLSVGSATIQDEKKKEIELQYRKLEQGLQKKNVSQVLALCSPKYVWVTETGDTIDRAGFSQMLGAQDKSMKFLSVRMINDSYDLDNDIARVRNQGHVLMEMKEGKKWARYKVVTECVDTWKKERKSWMLIKTEVTSTSITPM